MATIQHSGNTDNPESFSQRNMEHAIRTHNETIDAITFVLNYTERSNKPAFEKSLQVRNIDNFSYWTTFPQNKLISALGKARDSHIRDGGGPYDAFSPFLSLKIRNEISEYENAYSEITKRISDLNWTFQKDILFAFDKLCSEIKRFKSKYKHVAGLHKMFVNLDQYIKMTAEIIGTPEIDLFNGSLTLGQAIAVSDKLSKLKTPISPLHMYHDILRFQTIQEIVKDAHRERSRSAHYTRANRYCTTMSNQNIELTQIITDLEAQVRQLQSENNKLKLEKSQMIATNTEMAHQIATMRSGLLGKMAFMRAQRKK